MNEEKIGLKIKEFRKQRKLTQTDLAKALDYSDKSVISHIENGDADMTYEKILLLLRTYAVDANDLFGIKRIDKNLENLKKSQYKNENSAVKTNYLPRSSKGVEIEYVNSEKSMRLLKEKEFVDNLDFYGNLVHDKKVTLMVRLDNGSFIYVKPVDDDEIR